MDFLKNLFNGEISPKQKALLISIISAIAYYSSSRIKRHKLSQNNSSQIKKAQNKYNATKAALSSISKLPKVSDDKISKILSSNINELRGSLDSGDFSCEDLLITYLNRLKSHGISRNLINAVNIEEALTSARILDEELKSGHKRGLFHGIPISVKDMIPIKNFPATIGLTKFSHNIQTEDFLIIDTLRKEGAVFYVTGTTPQGLAAFETKNLATGQAENPWNSLRTPGGSSGGDAGMAASGCCALGIGTELYGSIRVPAAFCGLYGIKPTSNRISKFGPNQFFQPLPALPNGIGPMGKSTEDLAVFFQALCSDYVFRKDPLTPPIFWNEEKYREKRKLKIGYIESNNYWPLPECMKRALNLTRCALEGHEFIKIELPDMDTCNELLLSIMENSTPKEIGEPDLFRQKVQAGKSWFSQLKKKFIKNKETFYANASCLKTAYDYVKNLIRVTKIKNEFMKNWAELGIDAIIGPYPVPAMLHGSFQELYPGFIYATFFNLLDCPAGNVPVGLINDDEQFYPETEESWTKVMNKNMKDSKGLPLCVQVMAPPYKEELCLNVMKQIEEKIPFWKIYQPNLE